MTDAPYILISNGETIVRFDVDAAGADAMVNVIRRFSGAQERPQEPDFGERWLVVWNDGTFADAPGDWAYRDVLNAATAWYPPDHRTDGRLRVNEIITRRASLIPKTSHALD